MGKLDQTGVAAVAIVVIVATSTAAAVATPVVVDAIDVDPDSPFYGLERFGETIRGIGGEQQMKERWGEYARLVERGGGVGYRHILQEFVDKMQEVAPGDVAVKQEIVRWMQEQMPGMGLVRLRLCKELARKLMKDVLEVSEEIENEIDELEELEQEIPTADTESIKNISARIHLKYEKLLRFAERHRERLSRPVDVYINIDNLIVNVNVMANVEVNVLNVIPRRAPLSVLADKFAQKLEMFENELAEISVKLDSAPENTNGKHAAERLIERAIALSDKAVQAHRDDKVRRALGLIHAADTLLRNAEIILERAGDWEHEHADEWIEWKNDWQTLKETLLNEGSWHSMMEQWTERVRERYGWDGQPPQPIPIKPIQILPVITATGVLEKPEVTVWMYGTYLLTTRDGTRYALVSTNVDLDALIGKTITIGGTVIHTGIDSGPAYVSVTHVAQAESNGVRRR